MLEAIGFDPFAGLLKAFWMTGMKLLSIDDKGLVEPSEFEANLLIFDKNWLFILFYVYSARDLDSSTTGADDLTGEIISLALSIVSAVGAELVYDSGATFYWAGG